MPRTIAVYEPEGFQFGELRRAFKAESGMGWEVLLVSTTDELVELAERITNDLLAVVPHSVASERDVIAQLRSVVADVPVIAVAEQGNVSAAASAIDTGATDFLVLGDHLRERVATLLGKLRGLFAVLDRNRALRQHNDQLRESLLARFQIIGDSPVMRKLAEQIRRVSEIPRPVLIIGERGTGKELVARAIHNASGKNSRPLVTVNCAAFSDSLLESELFGHEKGSFTGAETTRQGKFEQADGGTLFLDEIGHMSLAFQQKILRVAEYGVYTRVGGLAELKSSARIITATNSDLKEKIRDGEFLPDLYDRLAFEVLQVPALRDRKDDIPMLAQHILDEFARETPAFRGKRLSRRAIAELRRHSYPGNVRELKNIIERAAYRDTTDEITPSDLGLIVDNDAAHASGSFHDRVNAFTRRILEDALKAAKNNQAEAARQLGLSYHQFRYYLKKQKQSE